MIRLRTLGECVMEIDGVAYGPECDALFAGLVYLTAERGRKVSRAQLAELLWPRLPAERGRHNLRQLLYRMKMAGVTVDGGRDTLVLPAGLVAPTFSAAPAPERLVAEREAGTLRLGSFLPGYGPTFSDPFADWVERARATTEARVRRVLLEVAQAHRLRGEWEEVEALASDCLRLDPLNEEATLARAEATAMLGEKHEAVAILDRYLEEVGPGRAELRLPATVLRRRIAERFPTRRYAGPSERCFVGRAALMHTLSTALLRARNGEGSAALLVGAPGIGKTRLVQELSRVAVMQGVRVVRASVAEADVHRPLAAFVDAVPQLRALKGAIGVSPEGLSFLDRLTEAVPPPATAPEETRDPRWLAGRIRQSIVDLCDAVALEGTLLLAIEDVHWLDASSWATVDALLEWLPTKRALLVLTSRGPHPTPATPRRCVERLAVHPIATLPPDAAHTFARAIVADHGGTLRDDARGWCVDVGEGNPLFLRELVIHCLEGGTPHAVPPSLQGLLDARIARLTPTARRVLDAIAILGDLTTVERLAQALELQAHQLAGALAELSEALLLDDASVSVALRHELVAQRVMSVMAGPVRRLLHGRAAVVLASSDAGESVVDVLLSAASHWRAAGDVERAITTLSEAAGAVGRLGAIPDVIRLLETALAFNPGEKHRAVLMRRLTRALALDGRWERIAQLIDTYVSEASPDLSKNAIAADVLLGLHAAFLNGALDPLEILARLFSMAADPDLDASHRLAAARRGVVIAAIYPDFAYMQRLFAAVQQEIENADGDSSEVLELRIIYEGSVGDMSKALEYAQRLGRIALNEPDAFRRLSLLLTVAEAYRGAGHWEESLKANETLLAEARRLRSGHFEFRALQRIANILVESGRVGEARPWIERAEQAVGSRAAQWYREAFLEDRARLAIFEGRLADAQALVSELLRLNEEEKYRTAWNDRTALTLCAETALFVSGAPIPAELLDALERLHQRASGMLVHDRTVAVLALSLERAGRTRDATMVVQAYVHGSRREVTPWRPPADQLGLHRAPVSA